MCRHHTRQIINILEIYPLNFKVVLSSFIYKEAGTWGQGGYHEVGKPGIKPTYPNYRIHSLYT